MRYRIFGSCVTRDAFEFNADSRVGVERYFARSSMASAFASTPFKGVDTSSIPSPFQRRIVEWDLSKEFASTLGDAKFDCVIVDLIDERFDLVRDSAGALATRSNEFQRASGSAAFPRIASGSQEFLALWSGGWSRFMQLVDSTVGRQQVFLHRALWAEQTASGAAFRGQTPASIRRANDFLESLYRVVEEDLPAGQIIAPARRSFIGADEHKWGPSPFHYTDDYYRQFLQLLAVATGRLSA